MCRPSSASFVGCLKTTRLCDAGWCLNKIQCQKWNSHQPQAQQYVFCVCSQEDGGPIHAVLGGPEPDVDTVAATLCLALHLSQVTGILSVLAQVFSTCFSSKTMFRFRPCHSNVPRTYQFSATPAVGPPLVSSHVRNLCCMIKLILIVYHYCSSTIHKFPILN